MTSAKCDKKIGQAVIAGVGVILVLHAFFLQFVVQRSRAFFEAVVIILATVEIDGELPQGCGISSSPEQTGCSHSSGRR